MSLASHFKQKSTKRTARLNLSIVKPGTGERKQVSIGGGSELVSETAKTILENKKELTFDSKESATSGDCGKHTEKTQFTFGFDLQEEATNISSKSRKRRNRNRKKKKTQASKAAEESNSQAHTFNDDTLGKQSLSSLIHATNQDATSILGTPKPKKDAQFRTAIRTPPGFCS